MARQRTTPHADRVLSARTYTAPNGLDRVRIGHAQLAEIQRARILSAMSEVVAERGADGVSVADVVSCSGVSRRTFYEHFNDRDDCFLAAFEHALAVAGERMRPACEAQRSWRERIRVGLVAFLAFLDEEPRLGRVLVCESLAGGPRTLERRNQVIAQLTRVIDEGRSEPRAAAGLPSFAGEGVLGGVLTVIQARLDNCMVGSREGVEQRPLIELSNPLMSMIVLPYLGAVAARRELDQPLPVPVSVGHDGSLSSDPFKDAGMRWTYRTVQVLMAIDEHPRASNRLVGDIAGIVDQGQISKLLGRLERIGLISNTGLGPSQGAPNAWTLTTRGEQLAGSIRAHTTNSG